jgi:hypothetical protein
VAERVGHERSHLHFCEESPMIGDPQFCRERAEKCRDLASTASDPLAQKTYASIGEKCAALADEIENAKAILIAVNMAASDTWSGPGAAMITTEQH